MGHGCGSTGDAVDRYELRGRVTDAVSGSGIGGARVRFVSDALDSDEVTTEGNGRYALTAVVAAGIEFGTLSVSREGYRPSEGIAVYFDGTERNVDVELRKLPAEDSDDDG